MSSGCKNSFLNTLKFSIALSDIKFLDVVSNTDSNSFLSIFISLAVVFFLISGNIFSFALTKSKNSIRAAFLSASFIMWNVLLYTVSIGSITSLSDPLILLKGLDTFLV